jgi:hypothetical protein
MEKTTTTLTLRCLKIGQFILCLTLLSAVPLNTKYDNNIIVVRQRPSFNYRSIAYYAVHAKSARDDNAKAALPYKWRDEQGILTDTRAALENWNEKDQHAESWNLESSPMFVPVSRGDKMRYVRRQTLRYFDKKLTRETREAKEGSTLKKLDKAQKALKPSATVKVSEKAELKLKAHVLEGTADVILKNPYVQAQANVKVNGRVNVEAIRDFKDLGVSTKINYNVNDSNYTTSLDKQLGKGWVTRVSSTQNAGNAVFSDTSDSRVEFLFATSF